MNAQDAHDPFRRDDEASPKLVRTSRLARLAENSVEYGLTFGIASVLACAYSLVVIGVALGIVAAIAFALPTIARARIARRPDLADAPALAPRAPRARTVAATTGPGAFVFFAIYGALKCAAALNH